MQELERSPFRRACQEKFDLYKRPHASAILPNLNIEDKYSQTSQAFMSKLATAVTDHAFENWSIWESMEKCMTLIKGDPSCKDVLSEIRTLLPKYVKEARYHLAMSVHPVLSSKTDAFYLNSNLSDGYSYKSVEWEPLTPKEKAAAQKHLDAEVEDARKSVDARLSLNERATKIHKMVETTRLRHFETYQSMVSQFGLLNYLSKPEPTEQELLAAVRKMKDDSMEELTMLRKAQAGMKDRVTSDSLVFLKYRAFVEGLLLQNPKECGLATYLKDAASNRETGRNIAIGVPLLAAALLAPPLIPGAAGVATGVGIGTGTAAGFAVASDREFEDAKLRDANKYTNEWGGNLKDTNEILNRLQDGLNQESTLRTDIKTLEKKVQATKPGPNRTAVENELKQKRKSLDDLQKLKADMGDRNKELYDLKLNRDVAIVGAGAGVVATSVTAVGSAPIANKLIQIRKLLSSP